MDIALKLKDIPGYKFKTIPADISILRGDLKSGSDLETAILGSLFLDRRADPADKTSGNYRGGWQGDEFLDDPIGSRLWLLFRGKVTRETVNKAKVYCNEALVWLVKAGAVASFDLDIQIGFENRGVAIGITALQPSGLQQDFFYSYLWDQIEAQV
jgi:phage gp46-like protein